MLSAPLLGWRHVKVTDRRAKPDLAHVWKDRADVHFPEKKIVVVMDHLNTHKRSTLYNAFKPAEARRLVNRFEGSLYTQARELVKYGRNCNQCHDASMSGTADP